MSVRPAACASGLICAAPGLLLSILVKNVVACGRRGESGHASWSQEPARATNVAPAATGLLGMRISSKAVYALRALFDITYHNHGRPTKVEAIAEREDVPPRFLEQIFQDLKQAGLVGSKRGPNGGYFLLRSPETVSIGHVVRAIEGPFESNCCFATDGEVREKCRVTSKCVTAALWRDMTDQLDRVLDSMTLSDLAHKGELLGVARDSNADFSYVI